MDYERIVSAANRVLGGDESRIAAEELETAILAANLDDDRWEDLLEALALYAPGSGTPYYEPEELRAAIRGTLDLLLRGNH